MDWIGLEDDGSKSSETGYKEESGDPMQDIKWNKQMLSINVLQIYVKECILGT